MQYSPLSRRALLLALFATVPFAARAQHIGVGTLTPTERLDVVGGNLKISTAGNGLIFPDGTTQTTAASGTGTGSFILNNPASQQAGSFNLNGAGTVGGNLQAGTNLIVDAAGANTGTTANILHFGAAGTISGEGIGSKRNAGGNQYGLDFYTTSAARLSITQAGNVGIGTSAPGQALEVNGNVLIPLTNDYLLRDTNHGLGYYGSGKLWNGLNVNGPALYGYAGGVLGTNQGGTRTTALTWNSVGNVGIGTSTPAFPLDVQTTATTGAYSFGYLNGSGQTGSGSIGANGTGISIRATGRILSSEFNAVSDRRLKTVVGLSDRTADLALLNKLRITDYTMRDKVQFGNRAFKKVIAQEVEAVFPQAVHQQTGFLPDVYALATAVQALPGDSLVALTLPAAGLPTAAAAGQRLRLMGQTGDVLAALARPAAAGTRTLVLRRARALAGTQVFVFGLEHPDVRSVDYEALSMLNVSATQELARKVEALEKQNTALAAKAAAFEGRAAQADADHASLVSLQEQMARLLGETPPATAQARK
ncbi:hypothetical protein GCM10028824_09780 [Hymenobacter segetis]|uniref:Tail fiber domain-containing protein n=1 Tax=Hymenobacter segetis TaxID=2025509 RepID=A0ABU9LU78_9BACT